MAKKKLWIIDDDRVFQALSKKLITSNYSEFEVECFFNGLQAYEAFTEIHQSESGAYPSVILLDLNMPEMNGWQFLEAIENYEQAMRHIDLHIVSSSIDPEDINRAKDKPTVRSFVAKPLNPKSLQSVL